MPQHGSESAGVGEWVRQHWRALVAELVATALLVLLGVATTLGRPLDLTHPALGFGFVVLMNVEAFGGVSGAHMNPAVTLAALLYGRIGAALAAAYFAAQMVGALVGFGALVKLMPEATAAEGAGCTGTAAPLEGMFIEALLTGALVLAACGLWAAHDDARPDTAVGIKLALTVSGLVYAGGPATGASLNPARSFAPAVVQGFWKHHWVYWTGPLGGAALAALLHRYVLAPPRPAAPPLADEALPLQDKV